MSWGGKKVTDHVTDTGKQTFTNVYQLGLTIRAYACPMLVLLIRVGIWIGFALLTDSWDMRRQMLSREGSAGGKTLHDGDVNRCL